MNTKNQTSQLVIGKSERLKKKKKKEREREIEKRNLPGLYAYQNVLFYKYLQHKPTLTHT